MALYNLDTVDVPRDLVLVSHLAGFVDAGNACRLATGHIVTTAGPGTPVGRFDVDSLLDYRGRRPTMHFDVDKWTSYEQPELRLDLLHDLSGAPFLFLRGPEPDYRWEAFVAGVREIIDVLGVRLLVGMNAIAMGVPHTRPSGVILHGTKPELVRGSRSWVGQVQVPGHLSALLEFRMGEADQDAMTFTVNVPHYIAQTDYPEAAAVLVENIAAAAGLRLDPDGLREAAVTTRTEIDAEVAKSAEVAAVVGQLERQYDALIANPEGMVDLPTADELGAELERYLADRERPGQI